jgi:hypothetical protein
MKRSLLIGLLLVCVLSTLAMAARNPDAKVAIYVRPHNAKAGCSLTLTDCSSIVTTEASFSVDAFPVFFDLTEFLGCAYSLTWPDWEYSGAMTNCADFIIGNITRPGNQQYAAHTWTSCQTGICIPSFIWLYADGPGSVCVIDPVSPDLGVQVIDCNVPPGIDEVVAACCAGVFGDEGDDPCDCPAWQSPVEGATWGEIKGLFR